jgi:hypothetical protein
VQSQQHYEEDFTEANSIVPYIVVGVVIVALFVLSIVGVLKLFM